MNSKCGICGGLLRALDGCWGHQFSKTEPISVKWFSWVRQQNLILIFNEKYCYEDAIINTWMSSADFKKSVLESKKVLPEHLVAYSLCLSKEDCGQYYNIIEDDDGDVWYYGFDRIWRLAEKNSKGDFIRCV